MLLGDPIGLMPLVVTRSFLRLIALFRETPL